MLCWILRNLRRNRLFHRACCTMAMLAYAIATLGFPVSQVSRQRVAAGCCCRLELKSSGRCCCAAEKPAAITDVGARKCCRSTEAASAQRSGLRDGGSGVADKRLSDSPGRLVTNTTKSAGSSCSRTVRLSGNDVSGDPSDDCPAEPPSARQSRHPAGNTISACDCTGGSQSGFVVNADPRLVTEASRPHELHPGRDGWATLGLHFPERFPAPETPPPESLTI